MPATPPAQAPIQASRISTFSTAAISSSPVAPGNYRGEPAGHLEQDLAPAWDSKFTININTEMNHWP